MNEIKLTEFTKFSGCGAKLGPGILDKALCGLAQPDYPELIAGYEHSEDAGVFKINDDIAVVQTVDFFPPIVDNPFIFGQIAAANSLSDIYAMGAKPVTAVSIVGFSTEKADISVLRNIMQGGLVKLIEAETALVGGHSIEDNELKYGFSVTGIIDPEKVTMNNSALPGEDIILTKRIGTGLVNTALRGEVVSKTALDSAVKSMVRLNKNASMIANNMGISSCTDITGFGLLGHAAEMVSSANLKFIIDFNKVPLIPDIMEYVRMGLIPAGTYRNKEFRKFYIKNYNELSMDIIDILFDPQTSGGLLLTMSKKSSAEYIRRMEDAGEEAYIIGETVPPDGISDRIADKAGEYNNSNNFTEEKTGLEKYGKGTIEIFT